MTRLAPCYYIQRGLEMRPNLVTRVTRLAHFLLYKVGALCTYVVNFHVNLVTLLATPLVAGVA